MSPFNVGARTRDMWSAAAFVCLAVTAFAGCFSPQFDDGKISCSAEGTPCPPGMTCVNGLCTRNPNPPPEDAARDAGVDDGPVTDGPVDAPIDAPPPPPPAKGQEMVTGAGRVTSATYQMDVQVGNFHAQSKATSATFTIEGNATVKP